MAKQTPNYLLVLIMLLIAAGVAYWARTRPSQVLVDAGVSSIPAAIGEWARAEPDVVPDQETLRAWAVTRSDFLSRTYVNPDGVRLTLMLVYKGRGRRDWHLPELCFRGSGYEIVSETFTTVPFDGRPVKAVRLIGQRDDTREVVVYWFAAGTRTEADFGKLQYIMALSRLIPQRYGWTFIRVSCEAYISDDDALQQIREFVAAASGPLVDALTGSGPAAAGLTNAPNRSGQ